MTKFELTEITTGDNLIHQGIFATSDKPGKKALLWVHGLTSKFYSNTILINLLADACVSQGMGFASFNNRGHDIITGLTTLDSSEPTGKGHVTGGAGYERFEDSVNDIGAGVDFLRKKGFSEVIVAGHSSGANKVCYYAATVDDAPIAGIILAGPLSDRYSPHVDKDQYENNMTMLKMLRDDNKGESLLTKVNWFPLTADRAWSLIAPNTREDVFNYGDTDHTLETFAKITKPTLIVLSGSDENADRPIEDIRKVFDEKHTSARYLSVILPDANHSFEGKEREFSKTVVDWMESIA